MLPTNLLHNNKLTLYKGKMLVLSKRQNGLFVFTFVGILGSDRPEPLGFCSGKFQLCVWTKVEETLTQTPKLPHKKSFFKA